MTLYDAIPSSLTTFKDICQKLGVIAPTPELREEMKQLITSGKVIQEGERRGAKYRRSDPSSQSDVRTQVIQTSSSNMNLGEIEKSFEQTIVQEILEPGPKNVPALLSKIPDRWEWVDPSKYQFVQWDVKERYGELHTWILENWRELGTPVGDLLEIGARIMNTKGCPSDRQVDILNSITDLAQIGKIHVRVVYRKDGTHRQYGWWPETPEFP